QEEYDRMLPLKIVPAPAGKPVRVGVALHPHMEIEPELALRIGALIRDLDDSSFERRVAAGKVLREVGPFALGMLQAELNRNPSPEKKRRIQEILEQSDAGAWLDQPTQKRNNVGLRSGMVLFMDGNTTLGTVPLDDQGQSQFTPALEAGNHVLSAVYEGSDSYL